MSVLRLCSLSRQPLSWIWELRWASAKLKGKALISIILRLAWSAFIYWIWRERNYRQFDGKRHSEHDWLSRIKGTV